MISIRRLLTLIRKDKIDTKGVVYPKSGCKFHFISNFSKFSLQKKKRSFRNVDVLIGQMMLFSARAREGKIFAASRCKITGHRGKEAVRAREGSDVPTEIVMDMDVLNSAWMLEMMTNGKRDSIFFESLFLYFHAVYF